MTIIDPVTGWFEVAELKDRPTAAEAQKLLDSVWIAQYLRLRQIGFDGGGEFKAEFRELCDNMGIAPKPSRAWNLQSNKCLETVSDLSTWRTRT